MYVHISYRNWDCSFFMLVFEGCMLNYWMGINIHQRQLGRWVSFLSRWDVIVLWRVNFFRFFPVCQDLASIAKTVRTKMQAGCRLWMLKFAVFFCLSLFLRNIDPLLESSVFFCFWGWIWMKTIDILYIILYWSLFANPTLILISPRFWRRFPGFSPLKKTNQASGVEIPENTLQEQLLRQCQVRIDGDESQGWSWKVTLDHWTTLKLKWMFLRFQNHFWISPI